MTLFSLLKLVHVSCALLSIGGFFLRGYWAVRDDPRRGNTVVRVLPHLVDTALLASAVAMLVIWRVSPLDMPWVMAKILALLLYIGLGMAVMRFAQSRSIRLAAYIAALLCVAYIVCVALSHSPWGPLVLFG